MNTETSGPIRVLLVDDHPIVRSGLRTLLAEEPDIEVVGEAGDGEEGVERAVALRPDVVLLDLKMPGVDGLETIRRLGQQGVASRVLVLTSFSDEVLVGQAIELGATGYLLKDVLRDDLVRAIREASQGRPTLHPEVQQQLMRRLRSGREPSPMDELTTRELDVLRLLASGRSNRQIATELYLSEGTVKGYVSAILAKLQVADRTQAALFAVRHGLVPAAEP